MKNHAKVLLFPDIRKFLERKFYYEQNDTQLSFKIRKQKEKNNKLGYKGYGISAKSIQPFVIPYYI